MLNIVKFLFFCSFFVFGRAENESTDDEDIAKGLFTVFVKVAQCINDTTLLEILKLDKEEDLTNPSDNILCVAKCAAQNLDLIKENGEINNDNLDIWTSFMEKEAADSVASCARKVKRIETCADMRKIGECL